MMSTTSIEERRDAAAGAGSGAPTGPELPVGSWLSPLVTELDHLWSDLLLSENPRRKVLFTGTSDDVGVTTISALAAHGIARNLRRLTLLVETNVSRPGLARMLPGAEGPGFSEFCRGEATDEDVIRRTEHPLLHVLPAGSVEREPGLFAAHGVVDRLDELTRIYDRVIFDAAPIVHRPDTVLLMKESDAVVLVARAHRTLTEEVRTAVHRIELSGAPLIGTVLNRVKKKLPRWLEPQPSGGQI